MELLAALSLSLLLAATAHAELRIPASTAYAEPSEIGARIGKGGITGWKDPAKKSRRSSRASARRRTASSCAGCIRSAKISAAAMATSSARRSTARNGSAPWMASGARSPRPASATIPLEKPRGWIASWAWRAASFSSRTAASCRASRSSGKSSRGPDRKGRRRLISPRCRRRGSREVLSAQSSVLRFKLCDN